MQFTAQQINQLLGGQLVGVADVLVHNVAKIEEGQTGDICFLANPKYQEYAYTTKASVLIVGTDFEAKKTIHATLIRVADPYAAFSSLLEKYRSISLQKQGIEMPCFIDDSVAIAAAKDLYIGAFSYIGKNVQLGKGVQIYPNCYIGDNSKIGDGTIIYAGVKIYDQSVIGNNCILHSGVVIGSDGFGFAPQADGTFRKIPQVGNVIIEANVEIGANTCIDRATMGSTIIRQGVKLDNLIQIAHNVEIGAHTVIAAQTGVSGSTKLGQACMIGGQVGFVGHIKIADGTKVNAQSGISKSIKQTGLAWNGTPAFAYRDSLRSQVVFKQLPDMLNRIKALEKALATLQS